MPYELRPYPAPTLRPEENHLQSTWRNSVYPLAARLAVTIQLPDVSPQPYTRKAFEGLEYAKDRAMANAYNTAVMWAFFRESRNIGELDVLTHIAASVGLEGGEFRAALENGVYAGRVESLLRHAYENVGVSGVPFFMVGKRPLRGLQSRQTLEQAIEQELEPQRA